MHFTNRRCGCTGKTLQRAGGRRVSCRHYICLYSLKREEKRNLITALDGQ